MAPMTTMVKKIGTDNADWNGDTDDHAKNSAWLGARDCENDGFDMRADDEVPVLELLAAELVVEDAG